MRKSIHFIILLISLASYSQAPIIRAFDPPVICVDAETYVAIPQFQKIESVSSTARLQIKSGDLRIRITGVIDKMTIPNVTISVFADETESNKLLIFADSGNHSIQYHVAGQGCGGYGGIYNNDCYYKILTRFKISAPGYPSYILDLPVSIYINPAGFVDPSKTFIDGVIYVYNDVKKKKARQEKSAIELLTGNRSNH